MSIAGLNVRMIASRFDRRKENIWKIITEDLGAKSAQKWYQNCRIIRLSTACRCKDNIERLQTETDGLRSVIIDKTLIFE